MHCSHQIAKKRNALGRRGFSLTLCRMHNLAIVYASLLLFACSSDNNATGSTAQKTATETVALALIDIEFSEAAATRALLDGPDNIRIVLATDPCPSHNKVQIRRLYIGEYGPSQ